MNYQRKCGGVIAIIYHVTETLALQRERLKQGIGLLVGQSELCTLGITETRLQELMDYLKQPV